MRRATPEDMAAVDKFHQRIDAVKRECASLYSEHLRLSSEPGSPLHHDRLPLHLSFGLAYAVQSLSDGSSCGYWLTGEAIRLLGTNVAPAAIDEPALIALINGDPRDATIDVEAA